MERKLIEQNFGKWTGNCLENIFDNEPEFEIHFGNGPEGD